MSSYSSSNSSTDHHQHPGTGTDHHQHPGTGTDHHQQDHQHPAGTGTGSGPVRNGLGSGRYRRADHENHQQQHYQVHHDPVALKRTTLTSRHKRMERALSRDAGSLRRSLPTSEDSFPTALPMLLSMVQGDDRLPADEGSQEVLRGKLRLLETDSQEVTALFTELSAHLLSVNCDENVIFVTFKTFEEIWKFSTYCTLGFVGQCMETFLLDQAFWLDSVDEDRAVGLEVSIQEDTLNLMYQGLLMQDGSLFASCTASQMFDSSTFGGDLYLEQGDIAQFEPPFLGSGWTVHCLGDGARGTKPSPALEPVVPFYQWFLKSCPENILVGGGKPACEFPLQFARGRCVATADYDAEGPDELTVASGDDIIIVGLLVSCFDWFVGRLEATGEAGLVRTSLVKPTNDICESSDIFLDEEEREFFSLREEQVTEETLALLKKTAQIDVGHIYKLDPSNQQDPDQKAAQSGSSGKADATEPPSELKRNIWRILNPEKAPPSSRTTAAAATDPTREGGDDPVREEEEEEAAAVPAPRFTVHPVEEGSNNTEHFAALLAFLDGADCKPGLGALYGLTPELLASAAFAGHSDADELAAFLGAAREAARKKRLHWSQSRLCFLLGKLCAGRSKFSQARVYFEEALSVPPRDGFADTRLLASVYANLAAVYLLQKNAEKYFAVAERAAALLMSYPRRRCCAANAEEEGRDSDSLLKYVLKKAVLSRNAMAEARACFLLAQLHLRRGDNAAAVPFIERLLVLSAEESSSSGGPSRNVSPSHGYLSLGRLYRQLSLPHLSFSASRQAALHPSAGLRHCLSALALILQNTPQFYGPIFRLKKDTSSIPAQVAPYLSRALALTQGELNGGGEGDHQHSLRGGRDPHHHHHALSQALTLCLSQLFHDHGMVGRALRSMHALVTRGPPPQQPPSSSSQSLAASVAERNSALVWLAWLHVRDGRPGTAVEILDAVLAAMPEHCTTPQEGVVLNMRGVALRCMGDLRRAAESYQAAIDICEEFEDRHNWAVALANLGMLCLKAGAKRLAETHLLAAVEMFSELDHQEHHQENFITVLLELGQLYVVQGPLQHTPGCLEQGPLHHAKGCLEWALLLSVYADHAACQLLATQRLCQLYGEVSVDQSLCILYSEHLINLLQRHGDRAQEGHVLENISQLYLRLGTHRAYRIALDYTKRSLGIFIDLGRKEKEAYAWLQAGNIYHMLGQTELVDLYIQVAQDVGLGTGNTSFILCLLEAAGDVFFNSSKDRDKAVCFYRDRALPIAVRTGSSRARLRMCNKLVELLISLKMYGEAVEFAQTALDISVTLGERLNERVAYHRLATVHQGLGQFELAEHYFLKTLALCPAPLQFPEETLYYVRVYQTLGDIIFYDLKDPFDAAGYYHLALAAAMDLGNKRSQLELCTRLATIYHNFLKDRALSLFFYQKARGFAADLNVRRVNIAPPPEDHHHHETSSPSSSQYRTSQERKRRSCEERRQSKDQE